VVGGHSPTGWRSTTLAVIVPDRPADAMRRIGRDLCAPGTGLALGVSAVVNHIARFPLAGRQAAYAMAAGRPSGATVFEDLGVVQLVATLRAFLRCDGHVQRAAPGSTRTWR